MKFKKIYGIALLLVVALAFTGCLGTSISDRETEAEVIAKLNELTDNFIADFTGDPLDTVKVLAFFADPMEFVMFIGDEFVDEVEGQKAKKVNRFEALLSLSDEEREEYTEGEDPYFLELLEELVEFNKEHGGNFDNPDLQTLIDEKADIAVKIGLICDFIQLDIAEENTEIIEWASESKWSPTGLRMPRDVFAAFLEINAAGYWPFANSNLITANGPEKLDGKWYIDLTAAIEGPTEEEQEENDPDEIETGIAKIRLGFGKRSTNWSIDFFQIEFVMSVDE